jgi:hypothetical protein
MKKILLFLMLLSTSMAQSVLDATSTFSQPVNSSRVTMTDFLADQATGQGADDFVVNGIYIKYALVNGVQTQFVRAVFTNYQSKGFGGNFKVGTDANADGAIDIVYGVIDSGANRGIGFQVPTTGAVTPGSTSLGTVTNVTAFSSTNYSYTTLDFNPSYASLTFAVSFSSVQSALAAQGINVTENTFLRNIYFTATNAGAVNQDIFGVSGINNTLRFDSGGGFTEYQSFTGAIPVIPEPSTYGFIMMSAALGFISYRKWRKRRE